MIASSSRNPRSYSFQSSFRTLALAILSAISPVYHGSTRSITPGGGSYGSYVEWIVDNGLSGDWDDVDASGVANVFRYAFDVPTGDFGKNDVPPLLSITFDEYGRVVILTPELVNDADFTFTIEASDNLDGTGNRASTLLDPSGRTQVVEPTLSAKRFFRLKATEK